MKLLFDENLAPKLVDLLVQVFPGSEHVRNVGLQAATDSKIWQYAAEHDYTIVTKDGDFRQRSFLFGAPPKVIWIGIGNCSTKQIAELLSKHRTEVEAFFVAAEDAFLSLR